MLRVKRRSSRAKTRSKGAQREGIAAAGDFKYHEEGVSEPCVRYFPQLNVAETETELLLYSIQVRGGGCAPEAKATRQSADRAPVPRLRVVVSSSLWLGRLVQLAIQLGLPELLLVLAARDLAGSELGIALDLRMERGGRCQRGQQGQREVRRSRAGGDMR